MNFVSSMVFFKHVLVLVKFNCWNFMTPFCVFSSFFLVLSIYAFSLLLLSYSKHIPLTVVTQALFFFIVLPTIQEVIRPYVVLYAAFINLVTIFLKCMFLNCKGSLESFLCTEAVINHLQTQSLSLCAK